MLFLALVTQVCADRTQIPLKAHIGSQGERSVGKNLAHKTDEQPLKGMVWLMSKLVSIGPF